MTACRVLPLVATLMCVPFAAGAQSGDMPGAPSGPPGEAQSGGELGRPPPASSPLCRHLFALREETQKQVQAIQQANERRASAQEKCLLLRNFLAAETKWVKAFEERSGTCGVSPDVLTQVKDGHVKASRFVNRLCEAADLALRPAGPGLFDPPAGPSATEMWPKGDFWRPGEFERLQGFW